MKKLKFILLICLGTFLCACDFLQPSYQFIDLNYGTANSVDQGKVVGTHWYDGFYPYSWTLSDGFVPLEVTTEEHSGGANDISENMIVGWTGNQTATAWTDEVSESLESPPGVSFRTCAYGFKDTSIVGIGIDADNNKMALLWSVFGGVSVLPGPAMHDMEARSVSGDISVGAAWPAGKTQPFNILEPKSTEPGTIGVRWKSTTTWYTLPSLGEDYTVAWDIDNSTIVGCSKLKAITYAVVWHNIDEIHQIESLGGSFSCATSVSGKLIVGGSYIKADAAVHAFKWTAEDGIEDIHPDGWRYSVATGVDQMGNIVGYGQAEDGYRHGFVYLKTWKFKIRKYYKKNKENKKAE